MPEIQNLDFKHVTGRFENKFKIYFQIDQSNALSSNFDQSGA